MSENDAPAPQRPWYADVTRYQWLVLLIASLGWVFDVFEGQIFVASMNEAIPALAPSADDGDKEFYKDIINGCFLLGGALGGVLFGMLSDRIGRVRTMVYTILMYSMFTFVSAFSQDWWHMAVFRFLVAMGVGGEWAVASAMVAEVVPKQARARCLGIFHASSVFGTYMATAVGAFVLPVVGWRWGFTVGAIPAVMTIWIRMSLKEPEGWERARTAAQEGQAQQLGRFSELFQSPWLKHTVVGIGLALVGLATFWGAHIYGKNLMRHDATNNVLAAAELTDATKEEQKEFLDQPEQNGPLKRWEMLGMFLVTTGGGLGLLFFGPLSERIGRRGAFLFFHLGGFLVSLVMFSNVGASADTLVTEMPWSTSTLYLLLPIFGFLTLGMHAGYAVYFPELFPTRLRGTGAGVCFNLARLGVFPVLLVIGWLQRSPTEGGMGMTRAEAGVCLSYLFLAGVALMLFAPETRGKDLPE